MTDSRDGWLDDLAEASARIAQLEATIENLSFQANSLIERGSALEAENAELREDKARLDWLEGEASRETGPLDADYGRSLFRRNQPITRAAIDSAREGGE